jgi:branched-chain amino acid transport system substrate-binding protein
MFISDVDALGLETAQGLNLTAAYYWDLNDGTRAFAKRFQDRVKNQAAPTMAQAGVHSSLHLRH